MKVIGAGKFKAQCLALLDKVEREHETILVTKRGRPVVRVVPAAEAEADVRRQLQGSIIKEGDLISPVSVVWEAA